VLLLLMFSLNDVPLNIRISPSFSSFKRNLKAFYFAAAF